jgi:hypothetical protein
MKFHIKIITNDKLQAVSSQGCTWMPASINALFRVKILDLTHIEPLEAGGNWFKILETLYVERN